jgi:hypothetical protein
MSSTLISLLKADEEKKKAEREKPKLEAVSRIEKLPALENQSEIVKDIGRPISGSLDVQLNGTGRPKDENLDAKTPKAAIGTPKQSSDLDAKTPKNKDLDAQKTTESKRWVKYEKQRSTDRLSLRPDVEILRKIKVYCAENGFTLTEFFEIAAIQLIDLDAQKQKDLGVLTPLDDRRRDYLFRTKPSIINLFREYNKIFNSQTDWKPKDDAVGVKYNDVDLRVIEIGIIQTQSNILEGESDTKPERFKYYTREIDKFNSLGYSDQLLDAILTTNRRRWKEITGKEVDLSFLDKMATS